ncbi:sugar ABC transporter substrate-binding protein [Mycetocola miduiensis]|uniref:D-xylose transport system substrate-binding protein n=1 Tax=Mycetocola miduiensis TaxID=995034 RepID=A0A1I5AFE9_9MICO|nr:sugar ABC transporter substrate-binding protein [Mycetocola miduiensis]SFN61216.1 D-xylose transport system substrate-binding protein [Mycetocola miduiensis]
MFFTRGSRPPKAHLLVRTLAVVLGTTALLATSGCGAIIAEEGTGKNDNSGDDTKVVAMLMSDSTTSRWFQVDVPNVTDALEEIDPEAKVISFNAESSPDTQLSQARTAIAQGAKVLIVVSVDPTSAGAIVDLAHENDVQVIAYVHQITEAPIDYFVGFDPIAIGNQEGQFVADNTKSGDNIVLINGWEATSLAHVFREGYLEVLQPLFDSGERTLIGEAFTPEWLASEAQSQMDAFLAQSGNDVQAVLSENDQMAGGVIASLKTAGLEGKVMVTGLDAEPAALQRILLGTQAMTIYPAFKTEATNAATIAAAILNGETPDESLFGGEAVDTIDGETAPWAVTETVVVTKENMQVVVDDGYISLDTLCNGVPAEGVCG